MIRIISKENIELTDEQRSICFLILKKYKKRYKYININLLNDEELLIINQNYLQKDYLTDIISFNYSEKKNSIEGDLYISIDRVRENAKGLGVNWEFELNRIVIHGILHLCGENDYSKLERKKMTNLENIYLEKMVSRGT